MGKYDKLSREELLEMLEKQDTELEFKKYGITWDKEREPEKVVVDCQNKLPILKRVTEKAIRTNNSEDNIMIEGDNYHALKVLNYTHKGKVDVIYIDPPYNTGNQDFTYNDKCVDKEDGYRHSKWLNFMQKRLELAKDLLKDTGIIFISIDDNEQANLKLLCDKIFGEGNSIGILPTIMNLKGNNDEFGFSGTHEYSFVYAKNKSKCVINEFKINSEEELSVWEEDEAGYFKKGSGLLATSFGNKREERPYMYFPLLIKDNIISFISDDEYKKIYDEKNKTFDDDFIESLKQKYINMGFDFVLPINSNGEKLRWTWGIDGKFKTHKNDIIINKNNNKYSFYKKQRPELGDLPSKKPKSIFYKPEYSSGNGTAQIKSIFGEKVFSSPKPIELIKDFILLGGSRDSLILDFMAGSGTTGHAVLDLNKEDGGNRKFILCTNNEGRGDIKIAEDVCYPRIQKVISGYRKNGNGFFIDGLKGNLQYFKTDFVDNTRNEDQIRWELTNNCTDMLCVRENIFDLLKDGHDYKIFESNKKDRFMCVYYNLVEKSFPEFLKELKKIKGNKSIYMFSLNDKIDKTLFVGIDDCEFEPIPQNILDLYKRIRKDHIKTDECEKVE